MTPEVLEAALRRAGATILGESSSPITLRREITKADLYLAGLTGGPNSSAKRAALYEKLSLPAHLSTSSLLPVLNTLYTLEEFEAAVASLE
jgi:ribonuclease M5